MHLDAIRPVSAPGLLGESPFWHPDEQCLYWCDIGERSLHKLDPRSGQTWRWDFETEPACCVPLARGGVALGMRDGLWVFDLTTGKRKRLAAPPYDPKLQRFNDGKCDPQGRFWLGTIHEPRDKPAAALYCWDGKSLTRAAGDVTTSNGLAWSPDGRTLYWSDTRAHTVYALDFDPLQGSVSRRRVFARFDARQPDQPLQTYGGRPDGAAVDVEGCYWVAMYEGQRLLRLGPDGQTLAEVELPVRCPTMPCFGGPDLKTLYVTTASQHRPADELAQQPMAGCVLAMPVHVAGLPVNFYQG
ncbi:MAG: SMP-30/gluconolactonase/LRE family protein [Burkholderiales bacterium]